MTEPVFLESDPKIELKHAYRQSTRLECTPHGKSWTLTLMRGNRPMGSILLSEREMAKLAFHVYNQIDWTPPTERYQNDHDE